MYDGLFGNGNDHADVIAAPEQVAECKVERVVVIVKSGVLPEFAREARAIVAERIAVNAEHDPVTGRGQRPDDNQRCPIVAEDKHGAHRCFESCRRQARRTRPADSARTGWRGRSGVMLAAIRTNLGRTILPTIRKTRVLSGQEGTGVHASHYALSARPVRWIVSPCMRPHPRAACDGAFGRHHM